MHLIHVLRMDTHSKAIALVLVSTLVTSAGNALLKLGSQSLSLSQPFNTTLAIGVVLYGLSALMFILALRGGELSVIYPIYGLNFVWISLIALFLFDEPMPLLKWIGIIVVMAGIVMIGKSSKDPGEVIC